MNRIRAEQMLSNQILDEDYKNWFLINTPYPIILILSSYLYFVLKCGPEYMKDRKPFVLRKIILIYNATQILANGALVYLVMEHLFRENSNYFCTKENGNLTKYYYSYLLLKFYDLIETGIFVLRKKQNQVSFLHVYHHLCVIICGYIMFSLGPNGHHGVLILVNCAVHFVMYTYYFSSIYDSKYGTHLGWKKFVTQIQLVQFGFLFIHYVWPVLFGYCNNLSNIICWLIAMQNVVMMVLFGKFYIRNYVQLRKIKN